MPGAVLNQAKKLDEKVKKKRLNEGWLLVPGNASFGTNNFHVMAFEAKRVNHVAASQADGELWIATTFQEAVDACAVLGGGSHLVNIAEVQTINRNVEAQSSNWADGVIGSGISAGGGLKRGNVGANDSASYASGWWESGAGRNPKAKLVLSNGGELWDWSGNLMEFVYGAGVNGIFGTPNGVVFDITEAEWNSTVPDLSQERQILGPSNSSWTSDNGVGIYRLTTGFSIPNTLLLHGGAFYSPSTSGVFAFDDISYLGGGYATGFRCSR